MLRWAVTTVLPVEMFISLFLQPGAGRRICHCIDGHHLGPKMWWSKSKVRLDGRTKNSCCSALHSNQCALDMTCACPLGTQLTLYLAWVLHSHTNWCPSSASWRLTALLTLYARCVPVVTHFYVCPTTTLVGARLMTLGSCALDRTPAWPHTHYVEERSAYVAYEPYPYHFWRNMRAQCRGPSTSPKGWVNCPPPRTIGIRLK